ncbi:MAG: ABC transporter ATP-binding protein [Candidatus Daviesbacteria bacterium]
MNIIQTRGITKIYQTGEVETTALSDISFDIKEGEFVAIMGHSGSGKSTLMHILGALDTPTTGAYFLDGEEVAKLSDDYLAEIRNKKIGFVFQAFNLLPRRSAVANVCLPLIYAGIPERERIKKATQLLEMVGLRDKLDNAPNQLSGGQQQRVAIARSLAMDPSIIMADEPTGNLASAQGEEIMEIFQDLNKKGHTIIMITHEADIAEYAKRIITLRDGKIISDKVDHHQRKMKK